MQMLSVKTPRDLTIAPASVDILEMGEGALVIITQVTVFFSFYGYKNGQQILLTNVLLLHKLSGFFCPKFVFIFFPH